MADPAGVSVATCDATHKGIKDDIKRLYINEDKLFKGQKELFIRTQRPSWVALWVISAMSGTIGWLANQVFATRVVSQVGSNILGG